MSIVIGLFIAVGVVTLVLFGIAALRFQNLLVGVPKEKLRAAGFNLENIALNMAPHYLGKTKKLNHPELDRVARQMQIEIAVFAGIFFVLLVYAIAISL